MTYRPQRDYSFNQKLVIDGTMRTFEQEGVHIRVYRPTTKPPHWAINARITSFTTPESLSYSPFNEPDPLWFTHCYDDHKLCDAIANLIAEVKRDTSWHGRLRRHIKRIKRNLRTRRNAKQLTSLTTCNLSQHGDRHEPHVLLNGFLSAHPNRFTFNVIQQFMPQPLKVHTIPVLAGAFLPEPINTYEPCIREDAQVLVDIAFWHTLQRRTSACKKLAWRTRFGSFDVKQQVPHVIHVSNHSIPLSGLCRFLSQVVGMSHSQPISQVLA